MMGAAHHYLTMTAGSRVGTNFLLDPTDHTRIGRGLECDIVLLDPLCSRIHARLVREGDEWWLRDAGSRNGTLVNGQKIDEARLVDGSRVRLGSTEFVFHASDQPPTHTSLGEVHVTQTIIKEAIVPALDEHSAVLAVMRSSEHAQDLLLLYQLSLKLLVRDDPDDVVRCALELLHERLRASVVGFLWLSDEGRLKPKQVIPQEATQRVSLSDHLTEVVCRHGRAVWVASQSAADVEESLRHFADGICVPLIREGTTLGALHAYLEQGRFRQVDFDFAISLAGVLVAALVRARQQATLKADHQRLVASAAAFDELVGNSPPMRDLKSRIGRVAQATGCVLIRGESGSGKELVARALHRASNRADRPMLSVNCAAIPGDLMESQLFGHKKGAFTSADRDHVGWFQQADSGTLFLDEVGELTVAGQAKLLRILEGHPFLPVGGSQEISVDVRVIAATNRDLREFVSSHSFREDLYYRLSVFELYVAPLRERGSDLELLLDFFLDHFRKKHGRPTLRLSRTARDKLLAYTWPGNVRQLRNVIDSAVVMAEGDEIGPDLLGLRDPDSEQPLSLRLDEWERKLIGEALLRTKGNVPEAARLLGLGRATLYRKIEEYGIPR